MHGGTVVLIVVVIIALLIAAWALLDRQKGRRLRAKYGPEYDRLAQQERSEHRATAILQQREKRVAKYQIRSLNEQERAGLAAEWRVVQEHFVDNPRGAVADADRLIDQALKARGYPVAEFEQQAADLSVQYPGVVDNYRKAHAIAIEDRSGSATTEQLRQAMQHYRSLFEDVLGTKVMHTEHEEVRHV